MIKRLSTLLLLALAFPSFLTDVCAGAVEAVDVPISEWSSASVAEVYVGKTADIVLIDAGYDRNFCTGARCRVEREGVFVAEIVIAEAIAKRSAALITNLANNQTILTGDTVKLKTI